MVRMGRVWEGGRLCFEKNPGDWMSKGSPRVGDPIRKGGRLNPIKKGTKLKKQNNRKEEREVQRL